MITSSDILLLSTTGGVGGGSVGCETEEEEEEENLDMIEEIREVILGGGGGGITTTSSSSSDSGVSSDLFLLRLLWSDPISSSPEADGSSKSVLMVGAAVGCWDEKRENIDLVEDEEVCSEFRFILVGDSD